MEISQEVAILTKKNLHLSKQYGAWRLLNEFPDKGWKLESINKIARQPGSRRPRSAHYAENIKKLRTSCSVRSTCQNAPLNSWDFGWNWHSPFKCAQQDNSPRSPAQILQTRDGFCSVRPVWQFCSVRFGSVHVRSVKRFGFFRFGSFGQRYGF